MNELRQRDPREEEAAWLVGLVLESVGVMVDRGIAPIPVVFDLMGGLAQGVWSKLEGWVEDVRHEQGQEKYFEWMQRLALETKRHGERSGAAPAYRRSAAASG